MDNKKMYIMTYDHGGFVLWQEAVARQLKQAIEWLEKYPDFKIGLDYEAFTFDEMAKTAPEIMEMIAESLKKYPGRFGLGSTTYGQPLSLFISEESNVRQLTYAIRSNLKHFGQTPPVYCISEFALNNQSPQLLKLAGFVAAIMRTHVMNYGYQRDFDSAYGNWIGRDGTGIPAIPSYIGEGVGFCNTTLDNWIITRWPHGSDYSLEDFQKKFEKYEPLLASRYDDLTLRHEECVADALKHDNWEFVLLEDLPGIYGEPKEELRTDDNDFHGKMPWGYCGSEIFNGCRAAEVNAAIAERLNAMSVALGGDSQQEKLEEAWQNVLVAQHHDVTICGLLDLARRFLPDSLAASKAAEDASVDQLAARFAVPNGSSILAINTNAFPVTQWVEAEGRGCAYDGETPLPTESAGEGRVRILVSLDAMEIKRLTLKIHDSITVPAEFSWDATTGILTTPLYRIHLTNKGIASIADRGSKLFVDNGEGKLFRGYVEDVDSISSEEPWRITTGAHSATAIKAGTIGGIPFRFEMVLHRDNPRIECSASFDIHGQRIGRTGVTKGLAIDHNVNGSVHEEKLCFVLDANVDQNRRMVRDLPYTISDWDGQVAKPEPFWYEGATVLVDQKVSPEESFNSVTYLQGLYWLALRDDKQGIAVMNKGCMGSAILGNEVRIPLMFANEYPCGTRMLDGTFDVQFALYPFGAEISDVAVHRQALTYAYPVVCRTIPAGNGDLEKLTMANLTTGSESVILTALYPEDGAIFARFCNYSDDSAAATFSPAFGKVTAETDLLGNKLADSNGQMEFHPWQIKTLRIEL